MARKFLKRDTSHVLSAAERWILTCLVNDGSIFMKETRWTLPLVNEVYTAFVEHPDEGQDDFMTKLRGQMEKSSPSAQQLVSEMLWALLIFPSNMKARTKRQQVRDIWALSGQQLAENDPHLAEQVLHGIGSGGPGFNTYRPNELEYLISLVRDLKQKDEAIRRRIFKDYDAFMEWIESVPRKGSRQFRHMLRYFAFPDRVERISSDGDRRKILISFGSGTPQDVDRWNDRDLDDKLFELRTRLKVEHPSDVLDFYEPPLREKWLGEQTIKTNDGEVSVTVPAGDVEDKKATVPESRQSIQIQSKLARIGAVMGFKVWIPKADRSRVSELLQESERSALLQELPLNYDKTTLYTIELIDVLWLNRRSIVRAFEVEQTTAIYSGLLRMADLLALQPNMDIRLHIVAPDERREKVFVEMRRPVFTFLESGPMSRKSSFISYESVETISGLGHLAHTNDGIITEFEETAE